ncbi:MAG TPA: RIP metalloprotease RseP [Candidatus Limnocylindrales bacterium]|nr:RIP metalloprotease RseP [Candidatus Limnocylindrales bacterium]
MHDVWIIALYGALVLGVLVFVHELGHFLVAKWLGVQVLSFSIGMGPRLFGFRKGGTDYRVSLLPLGGFVRMAGDSPDSQDRQGQPYEFLEKPWWARALITAAGPFANLVLAFLINVAVYLIGVRTPDFASTVGPVTSNSIVQSLGVKEWDHIVALDGRPARTMRQLATAVDHVIRAKGPERVPLTVERAGKTETILLNRRDAARLARELDWNTGTVIGRVFVGLPAYQAGLREGDEIVSVNGKPVGNWAELSSKIRKSPDSALDLKVKRDSRVFSVTVKSTPDSVIGISLPETITILERFPFNEAVWLGVRQTLYAAGQIYQGLWSFATNPVRLSSSVAGPIAIAQVARDQARSGLDQLLSFASFISVALMAMNLLPIPILDGGHVLFAVLEGIRRRPLSFKTQAAFQRVGLAVLGGLVIFSFANDITRVSQRKHAEADINRRLNRTAPADTVSIPDGR